MKKLSLVLFLLVSSHVVFSVNPIRVQKDKALMRSIVKLDKLNPIDVEAFFRRKSRNGKEENLGFGWKMWATQINKGYVSVKAYFYYRNDSLMNYSIRVFPPSEMELLQQYTQWSRDHFGDSLLLFDPRIMRYQKGLMILPFYRGVISIDSLSKNVLEYLSPESGVEYGYRSGSEGVIPENRRAFNDLKDDLTEEEVLLLMYSVNPATRFTAMEIYIKDRRNLEYDVEILEWMELNFTEIPFVMTYFGCIGKEMSTKRAVYLYSFMTED